jgi:hypothetical protein
MQMLLLLLCRADPRLTDYDLLLTNLSDLQQGKAAEVRGGTCTSRAHSAGGGGDRQDGMSFSPYHICSNEIHG